jgi:transcriptional regulator with XRE-family HTH domain
MRPAFYLDKISNNFKLVIGGIFMLPNFKAVLAVRGVRQIDLALRLKIDPCLLSKVINGRTPASLDLQEKLAQALGVDAGWLFERTINIPNSQRLMAATQ